MLHCHQLKLVRSTESPSYLATAQESAKALAKVMQLSVRHVDSPMPMLL